jgi:hypothetical protein
MELAAAALTSVAGAIGSVFSTAAPAATTAVAGAAPAVAGAIGAAAPVAATSSFGWGSILSGVLSGGASLAGIMGAQAAASEKATAFELAAQDAEAEVPTEMLKGTEKRTSMRRSLLQTFGERDVAFAASGLDISFGTPALARDEAEADAERAIGIDTRSQEQKQTRLLEKAANLRAQGGAAKQAGFYKSLGLGLEAGASFFRRG